MVSADGGKSWAQAALQEPVLSKALTRFRMPWRWDGQPVVLQSRAWDEAGNVQPTRAQIVAERGEPKVNVPVTAFPMGHINVITSWAVDNKGEVKHGHAHPLPGRRRGQARDECGRRNSWPRPVDQGSRSRTVGHQYRPRRRRAAAGKRHCCPGQSRLR